MPRVAEIRTIDGEIWVRIGNVADKPGELSIMSPEEITIIKQNAVHSFVLDLYYKWKTQQ